MPLENSFLSRKRRHLDHPSKISERPLKAQKINHSPDYWDNLSKIHLTRSAIKELIRREGSSRPHRQLNRPTTEQRLRPITRQFQAEQEERLKPIPLPDFLRDCSSAQLKEIKQLSKLGGPDLSALRNYPVPMGPRIRKRRAESPPSTNSKRTETETETKTTTTSAYSRNFQQNLIDYGVYPPAYEYPDGRRPAKPDNWKEINERLARPRASLSPSRFSEEAFENFAYADANASKEMPVMTTVIPILDGNVGDRKCVGGEYPFGNLAPLTDEPLSSAKPDHFFGARPEQLNRSIREALSDQIIPSTQNNLPMVPNFFVEAKGPDGSLAVATRQACYDGALGARGMHTLQSYQQEPTYDNNAYTLTSTYHGGTLKLYTTHISQSNDPGSRPEYFMTQLKGWSLTGDLETFRQGASAYRNGRDWAKEKRNEFISAANERFHDAKSQPSSISQHHTSDLTPILDDSDGSTEPAGYQDAAEWSFVAAEAVSRGNPKGPRIRASESLGMAGDETSQSTSDKTSRLPN
ncbi:hypothetical protein ACJ72_01800 [Emergomyces africanus]|uniref:DUF7924 domain-containing protein n=1 Tax=Emergomyces africanus TaxID=1955775 RepID=A0A1B7P4A9_9EURO|nr:hypothetical protein ACJ72_01800 [Emergomyces africanus]